MVTQSRYQIVITLELKGFYNTWTLDWTWSGWTNFGRKIAKLVPWTTFAAKIILAGPILAVKTSPPFASFGPPVS